MSLYDWGWSEERRAEASAYGIAESTVRRVIGGGRGMYTLTDGRTTRTAAVSGAFAYRAVLPSDYPVTGDFVACREAGDREVVESVLPRRGVLSRKAPGNKGDEQVLAANVDAALLVFALDGGRGFLPRLAERLLTLVHESGAEPIIVLNKADLAKDPEPFLEEAASSAPGAEVILVSARSGLNLHTLRGLLLPRRTYFLLGKSGVGKSSLINSLFGQEKRKIREVRESDWRGRHATSSRDLLRVPNGALLLDSPGLREAALWADDESVDASFPEISGLAGGCRFRDCSHSGEPGCAVQEALAMGGLEYHRYECYLEYRREARYHKLRAGESAKRIERIRWKKISMLQRALGKD
mgnify:FL=1